MDEDLARWCHETAQDGRCIVFLFSRVSLQGPKEDMGLRIASTEKKRSHATSQFWYTDFSMIVLKRKHGEKWMKCQCILQGVQRACDCELFLDPDCEYCFIPISFLSGKEVECGAQVQRKIVAPFQFTTYSANTVDVKAQVRKSLGNTLPLEILHSSLLQTSKKITYTLGPSAVLVAVNGDGCIFFLVLNAADRGIVLNLQVEPNRGMAIVHGLNNDTHVISSQTQCIVLVLANDGRGHLTPCVNFSFRTDNGDPSSMKTNYTYRGVETKAPLSLAGELLCGAVDSEAKHLCCKGTLDERLWSTMH